MAPQLSRRQGFLVILLAGTMFSFGPLTFRAVVEADAWQYLFHRALGTAVVAALVIGIGGRNPITAIRRSGPRQQLAGVLLGTLFGIFVVALSRVDAAFILLLQCTSPFYAALFGWVFLGERVGRRTIVAMAVAAVGIVTMVGGNVGGGDALGIGLSLALPVCLGAYTTLVRSAPAEDPGAPTVLAGFFAAAGAGSVALGLEIIQSGDDRVIRITVRDTGIGIPADRLENVFEKFPQADATTARRFGGTGLGLPISAELARLMGGDLRVESELGKGSVFILDLPLRDVALGLSGGGLLLGLGVPMWNYAHRFVPVAEANLLLVTEIVLAPLWLWIWPGERPGTSTLLGGGIALGAVTWLTFVSARDGELEQAPRRVGLNVGAAPGYRRFVQRRRGA